MAEVLRVIFESPLHFFGTLFLLLTVMAGIVNAFGGKCKNCVYKQKCDKEEE